MRLVCKFAYALMATVFAGAAIAEDADIRPSPEVKSVIDEMRGGSPVATREVLEYLREYERMQQYAPRIKQRTQSVALPIDTLELPFELEVAEGYLSTITFLDARGTPFPTRVTRVGDSTSFSVCAGTDSSCTVSEQDIDIAHILTVGTNRQAGRSNLKVFFKGLHRAVQIPVVARKESYHDEVTVLLPIDNPDADRPKFAEATGERSLPQVDDQYARALIDSVAISQIPDATVLQVTANSMDGRPVESDYHEAVFIAGNTYIKTNLRQPNPSATAVTQGFLDTVVYRFAGKPRAVSGFDAKGNVLVLKLVHPDDSLGYRRLETP